MPHFNDTVIIMARCYLDRMQTAPLHCCLALYVRSPQYKKELERKPFAEVPCWWHRLWHFLASLVRMLPYLIRRQISASRIFPKKKILTVFIEKNKIKGLKSKENTPMIILEQFNNKEHFMINTKSSQMKSESVNEN